MADSLLIKLEGVDELVRVLRAAPEKIRKRAVRLSLAKAARVISRDAKARAPVLQVATKYRKPGTVKKAISVRPSKFARREGNEGVFVGVRPLSPGKVSAFKSRAFASGGRWSGKFNPDDPYYWRFVHFGHKVVSRTAAAGVGITEYIVRLRNGKIAKRRAKYRYESLTGRRRHAGGFVAGRPFLTQAAAAKGEQAIQTFMRETVPAIEKLNLKAGL